MTEGTSSENNTIGTTSASTINDAIEDMGNGDASSHKLKGEQALWRSVIVQALMDAGNNSSKMEMKYEKAQAKAWLAGNTKDFYTVCSLADMDPVYVKEKARAAMGRGCIWRADNAEKPEEKQKTAEIFYL